MITHNEVLLGPRITLSPVHAFQDLKLWGLFGNAMYTDYFGFREKPFGVTPDPRFFYTNPCYQEAYASLLYGIRERRGLIVLTGEVGTGKTTLLRRLMGHMESTVRFVFFYNTTLSFEELLDFMCEELGLPVNEAGRHHKIHGLNRLLMDQLARAGTVALLIDEAQNLGEEVLEHLRLLSNFETAAEKLLQIVLVGQPELESKLTQPELRQVKQRIAVRCRLERLDDEEVGPFINYRLHVVGYKRHQLFTPDAVKEIAYYSKGYPRLINILCDSALLIAYATSQRSVTGEIIEEAASDLRFELRGGGPLAAGESRHSSSEAGLKEMQETVPLGRMDHQRKAHRFSRKRSRITAAVLCLGIGGASFYVGQVDSGLVGGVRERLGAWHKTIRATLGAAIENPERRESTLRNYQMASVDERDTESTGKDGPASAADLLGLEARKETRDSLLTSEQTMTSGGGRSFATAGRANEEVSPIGSASGVASRPEKSMLVPSGSTIVAIAANIYGAQRDLGLDLIKEYNSQIENLSRIRAGQRLWLPTLSQETLVRPQPDGSYSLILASFRTSQQAEQLAQLVRLKGYDSGVSARPVSRNLVLHRVEINGLANLDAVERASEIAFTNRWIAVPDNRSGRRY
jgi:type II secretory pathway predicted ATPase ExeA